MFPSEIAFLAFGLVLGAAIGGAIAQALRSRPAPRREIKLTITPNAIPSGRTRTLASTDGAARPAVVPGSPDGQALVDGVGGTAGLPPAAGAGGASGAPNPRTRVPSGPVTLPASAVGVPVAVPSVPRPAAAPAIPAPRPTDAPRGSATALEDPLAPGPLVAGVAVLEAAPLAQPGVGCDPFESLVRARPPAEAPRPSLPAGAVAVTAAPSPSSYRAGMTTVHIAPPSDPETHRPRSRAGDETGAPPGDPGIAASATAVPDATGPCAGARRAVDERCALAGVARDQARAAADALREAQRAYDTLRERVDRAAATADPRRVAAEKDRLHATFRAATDRAAGSEETEAAARAWLDEINALNAAVRDATRIIESGGRELGDALPALERRSAEADAARIAAENAEAGCREAREELAACEEREARAAVAPQPEPEQPQPIDQGWPSDAPDLAQPAAEAPAHLLSGLPVIVRVLRGDRDAREQLVASLASGDPEPRQEWQLRISRLVDAITGRAIEDGYLDLPDDDPFWRLFDYREVRDIVGALSALGFRYDGMGGFADGRVPAARDLSLAVGYAGLDRMRIRTWPRDNELAELYARATVAADQWLADQAGDLSLGRMVDALGARAAELADVWNAWGRVRPALLAD